MYEKVEKRNPGETEFLQAVREVLESFEPVVEKDKSYETNGIIDRIVEPEEIRSRRGCAFQPFRTRL